MQPGGRKKIEEAYFVVVVNVFSFFFPLLGRPKLPACSSKLATGRRSPLTSRPDAHQQ